MSLIGTIIEDGGKSGGIMSVITAVKLILEDN